MLPSPEIRELDVKDYLNIFKNNIWLIILIVVVSVSVAAYRSFSSPEIYQVATTMLVEKRIPEITGKEQIMRERGLYDREDQIAMLNSRALAQAVSQKLDLKSEENFSGIKDIPSKLRKMVKVKDSPGWHDNKVNIVVTGKNPFLITKIANAWTEEFIKLDLKKKSKVVNQGIEWLEKKLKESLASLKAAETKLTEFMRENKLGGVPEITEKGEFPLDETKEKINEVEREIIEASKIYGPKHPEMVFLKEKLAKLKKLLEQEREKLFESQEKALEYRNLKREIEIARESYDDYLERIKEFRSIKEMVVSNATVLTEAHLPDKPIKPTPARDIIYVLIGSLAAGAAVSYVIEFLDSTLSSSEDIELYLNMPFLGYIPYEERREKQKNIFRIREKNQVLKDAFAKFKVALTFSFPEDKPLKMLGITSSLPKEGKSFCAANLAISFAEAKDETLLIDADLRRGSLSSMLGIKAQKGLSNILTGGCSFEEAVVSAQIPHLSFICRGPASPNPQELLHSKKVDDLLEAAKGKFKRIIIDSPPVLATADASLIGNKCDGVCLVVLAKKTQLNLIVETKKVLTKNTKIIGAVLNKSSLPKNKYYYYYSSYGKDSNL